MGFTSATCSGWGRRFRGIPMTPKIGPGPSGRESGRPRSPRGGRDDLPRYIFGGKLAGSITYQTLFTPCPWVSPGALSPAQ